MTKVQPEADATGANIWQQRSRERFLAMERKVKGLMNGLSEIAILDENAALFEAVLEIGIARANHPAASICPAALVVDSERNVAGFS